jgi:hypothetical protein
MNKTFMNSGQNEQKRTRIKKTQKRKILKAYYFSYARFGYRVHILLFFSMYGRWTNKTGTLKI